MWKTLPKMWNTLAKLQKFAGLSKSAQRFENTMKKSVFLILVKNLWLNLLWGERDLTHEHVPTEIFDIPVPLDRITRRESLKSSKKFRILSSSSVIIGLCIKRKEKKRTKRLSSCHTQQKIGKGVLTNVEIDTISIGIEGLFYYIIF